MLVKRFYDNNHLVKVEIFPSIDFEEYPQSAQDFTDLQLIQNAPRIYNHFVRDQNLIRELRKFIIK